MTFVGKGLRRWRTQKDGVAVLPVQRLAGPITTAIVLLLPPLPLQARIEELLDDKADLEYEIDVVERKVELLREEVSWLKWQATHSRQQAAHSTRQAAAAG